MTLSVDDYLDDLTEAGLGGSCADPPAMRGRAPDGYRRWSHAAVAREVDFAVALRHDPEALRPRAPWAAPGALPFPALRRLMVKTPEMMKLVPQPLGARPGTRYVEASGAVWSTRSVNRSVVALDPGGDLADWRQLVWIERGTDARIVVTTDQDDMSEAVVLETLDERAVLWSAPPRSDPIEAVTVDPLLIRHVGRVSGVIDAQEDGFLHLRERRPVYEEAQGLALVQREARRLGKRAFARRSGLALSAAERAARGRPISRANVDRALAALVTNDVGCACAAAGCSNPVLRPNALYCSKAHRDRAYRQRRADHIDSGPELHGGAPCCAVCGAIMLGAADRGDGICLTCDEASSR
jgi:hypothetical protein